MGNEIIKLKELAQLSGLHENTARKIFSEYKLLFRQFDRKKYMDKLSDMQERKSVRSPNWSQKEGCYT